MDHTPVAQQWQRALVLMAGTMISVVTVAVLYWAQSIFIPVALAVFLTFLLNPFVTRLRQWGLGRTPAVILIVCVAAAGLGIGGWVVTVQISGLLRELPRHTENIKGKVRSLKSLAGGSSRLSKMIHEINQELAARPVPSPAGALSEAGPRPAEEGRPKAVLIEPQGPPWVAHLVHFFSPLMEQLGQLALAIVLVIFMLQKREELRNRIIRLVGHGRIVAATRFVDEAAQRISRFLLLQAIVNGTFGLVLGSGLMLLGVKYAPLWGCLGAMLRYLPYIGVFLAAVLPVSLSMAVTDGWGTTFLVIALFVILELVVANFVEPRLYGQSMGVSEIALLVSAAMWAFLWGPIGLVLSSPLTVCLMTLGRYVPQLEFLDVLLGDAPALEPDISFYQRLLARDQDEALELVMERVKAEPAEAVYDTMLVPALCAAKQSRNRGEITEEDESHVLRGIREIIDELSDFRYGPAGEKGVASGDDPAPPPLVIFGCAGRALEDRVGLEALARLLDPRRWRLELVAQETLTSELLERVAQEKPAALCIAALPPGGLAHTRYLCKRLRGRFPELRIVVGRWGENAEVPRSTALLEEAGVLSEAVTLLETRQQLLALFPLLEHSRNDRESRGRTAAAASGAGDPEGGPRAPRTGRSTLGAPA
jgi:predicted PurR-regulated permease PerM